MPAVTCTGATVGSAASAVATLRKYARDRPLELPDAGLARVLAGDQPQRVVVDARPRSASSAARDELPGQQVVRAIATFSSSV